MPEKTTFPYCFPVAHPGKQGIVAEECDLILFDN